MIGDYSSYFNKKLGIGKSQYLDLEDKFSQVI
jgi:hypothetical protein